MPSHLLVFSNGVWHNVAKWSPSATTPWALTLFQSLFVIVTYALAVEGIGSFKMIWSERIKGSCLE